MSVDLAVWEGNRPASDQEAAKTFKQLYERYIGSEDTTPPTERIASYVDTLLSRYPDLTDLDDDVVDDSPWADGPLIGNARGPFLYFGLVTNDAAEAAMSFAIDAARSAGLICFDPQSSSMC